jgi:hypothetical protein
VPDGRRKGYCTSYLKLPKKDSRISFGDSNVTFGRNGVNWLEGYRQRRRLARSKASGSSQEAVPRDMIEFKDKWYSSLRDHKQGYGRQQRGRV